MNVIINNYLRHAYFKAFVLGALISGVLNSFLVLADMSAVAEDGSTIGYYLFMPIGLIDLVVFFFIPVGLIASIKKTRRQKYLPRTIFALAYVIVMFQMGGWAKDIRTKAFEQLAERSRPLVQAINQYERDHGQYPRDLIDLVPDYLPEVPKTGMGAYPDYEYFIGDHAQRYADNPWVLLIQTPDGTLDFSFFLYLPKQNYTQYAWDKPIDRIGDWAYFSD